MTKLDKQLRKRFLEIVSIIRREDLDEDNLDVLLEDLSDLEEEYPIRLVNTIDNWIDEHGIVFEHKLTASILKYLGRSKNSENVEQRKKLLTKHLQNFTFRIRRGAILGLKEIGDGSIEEEYLNELIENEHHPELREELNSFNPS